MILPIRVYGDPILRKKAEEISNSYPDLDKLIERMFQTMYKAQGIGLAAPQVGLSISLFVVDIRPLADDDEYSDIAEELKQFKKVFINAKILGYDGESWKFNEGCLSIPNIREDVSRPKTINIEYYDENFVKHVECFSDIRARVIQHEYDHIEGVLFTDKLSPLKKKIIKGKLLKVKAGEVSVDYKMKLSK